MHKIPKPPLAMTFLLFKVATGNKVISLPLKLYLYASFIKAVNDKAILGY